MDVKKSDSESLSALKSNMGAGENRKINETDYVCLLNYLNKSSDVLEVLETISKAISKRLKVHCIVNNAPDYLHSTGQLHKGGSNKGVFIQFCLDGSSTNLILDDYEVFHKLFNAQADGDIAALIKLNRRICRITISGDVKNSLTNILNHISK